MKIKIVHLWILTTALTYGLDIFSGMILTAATIVMISQEQEITELGGIESKVILTFGENKK